MPSVPYDEFRTGLTYREVYQMLWVHSEDSSEWKYKRRGTVLGFWRELKLQMYEQYQDRPEYNVITDGESP